MPLSSFLANHLNPYGGEGPPPRRIPWRFPFYAFVVVSAFWQMFVAAFVAHKPGGPSYLCAVGSAAGLVAAVTWLLTVFLIGGGRGDPDQEPIPMLSRCYFHVTSFVFMAVAWLSLGAFFAFVTKRECDHYTSCPAIVLCVALAFLTSVSALLSAAAVTCAVCVSRMRWSTHVEKARREAGNMNEDRPGGPNMPVEMFPQSPPILSP